MQLFLTSLAVSVDRKEQLGPLEVRVATSLVASLSVPLVAVSEPRGFGRSSSSLVGLGVVCRVLSRAALPDADIARTSLFILSPSVVVVGC